MKTVLTAAILSLVLAATAGPAAAQPPPEPLPMGVPYAYQPGNPYGFRVLVPNPSPYPFGATRPVFGRYSWDYTAYYPYTGMGWTQSPLPISAYSNYYPYPAVPSRVWYGYGW